MALSSDPSKRARQLENLIAGASKAGTPGAVAKLKSMLGEAQAAIQGLSPEGESEPAGDQPRPRSPSAQAVDRIDFKKTSKKTPRASEAQPGKPGRESKRKPRKPKPPAGDEGEQQVGVEPGFPGFRDGLKQPFRGFGG